MDRLLRVLHVQHSLEPGGMENGVVNVARALQPRGFEFHVACLARSGAFAERLPDPGLVHSLSKPEGFSPRTVLRLRSLIRRINPAILHTHNLGALIYAALATRFGRTVPILHGEHGAPDDGPDSTRRNRQRFRFFKAATLVHTVSHGLRAHFMEAGFPPSRLVALVNGVDTARYTPGSRAEARRALSIPLEAPVLIVVGRLISSKQHRLLFAAMEQVVAAHPEALLLVVGDGGEDREGVREAARTSPVAGRIRMEGFQSDPLPYYQAADLLVAPSQVEGLSNVVLEAMACALPPLLHDACGNREVIDSGTDGVVADLSSADSLSRQILGLLDDPDTLERFGRNARAKVESEFSLDGMADAYEQTYRQLAARDC